MQTNELRSGEEPAGLSKFLAWALVLIPLIAAFFYGVAGADKTPVEGPLTVAGYLFVLCWMLFSLFSRKSAASVPTAFVPLLLYVLYGIGVGLVGEIPYEAKLRMLQVGLVVGGYYVWSNTFFQFRDSRSVLGVLILFALLISMYGLIHHFKNPMGILWSERYTDHYIRYQGFGGRMASTYICPNHYAHLLQMLLPFCLVILFIPKAGMILRILAGYSFVVFWPSLFFTQSRAGMLGGIGALGVTALLMALRKSKKLFTALIVIIPMTGVFSVVGAYHASSMVRDRLDPVIEFVAEAAEKGFANTSTTDFRPLTWLDTLEMIKERPLSGYGPGTYEYVYPEFRERWDGARYVSVHPHSEYLEVAAEFGWIGLGIFAAGWVWASIRLLVFSVKTQHQHHAYLAMAFLGTIAGTLFHSLFDFQMHIYQNALIFALLAAVAVGPVVASRRRGQKSEVRGRRSEERDQRPEVRGRSSEPGTRHPAPRASSDLYGSTGADPHGNSTTGADNSAYLYPSQDETGGLDLGDRKPEAGGRTSEVRGQRSGVSTPHLEPGTGPLEPRTLIEKLFLLFLTGLAAWGLVIAFPSLTSSVLRSLGDRLDTAGKYEGAIEYYQRSIQFDDANWRAYYGYARIVGDDRFYTLEPDLKLELAQRELDLLEKGYQHNVHDAKLTMGYGKILLFVGRATNNQTMIDQGLEVLRTIKRMRPFNDVFWWELGAELRREGLYEEALETFSRSNEIKKSQSAKMNMEWLKNQLEKAETPEMIGPVPAPEMIEKPDLVIPEVEPASEDDELDALYKLMQGTN